ncbi:hypothetical protein [Leadbetterella sp. DM7]|uniref:hypothetical protein n=1 Tax=Leadbetterella sp. DM7 TaxID=3235085 RepID=UPI00349EE04D
MKKSNTQTGRISTASQWILIIGALSLLITYFVPIWRIDLWAPQYPEGLTMKIWLSKLSGQVEIINGLNHYIGMAHIKEEMFPEFKILPYCVAFLALAGVVAALLRKKTAVLAYFIVLVAGAVYALYDFWKWGYEYGHNLSDDAPIKVPGMAYQPPLLGYKELLNFGAYSIPDIGGWIFAAFGVALIFILCYEFKFRKHEKIS